MALFVTLSIFALLNSLYGYMKVKSFLQSNRKIDSVLTFNKFKKMVGTQMHLALLQILFAGGALIAGLYGVIFGSLSLILFISLQVITYFIGKLAKSHEERARSMSVWDEKYEAKYHNVCDSWLNKALPDFK